MPWRNHFSYFCHRLQLDWWDMWFAEMCYPPIQVRGATMVVLALLWPAHLIHHTIFQFFTDAAGRTGTFGLSIMGTVEQWDKAVGPQKVNGSITRGLHVIVPLMDPQYGRNCYGPGLWYTFLLGLGRGWWYQHAMPTPRPVAWLALSVHRSKDEPACDPLMLTCLTFDALYGKSIFLDAVEDALYFQSTSSSKCKNGRYVTVKIL
jgi:hypothetical protein